MIYISLIYCIYLILFNYDARIIVIKLFCILLIYFEVFVKKLY